MMPVLDPGSIATSVSPSLSFLTSGPSRAVIGRAEGFAMRMRDQGSVYVSSTDLQIYSSGTATLHIPSFTHPCGHPWEGTVCNKIKDLSLIDRSMPQYYDVSRWQIDNPASKEHAMCSMLLYNVTRMGHFFRQGTHNP